MNYGKRVDGKNMYTQLSSKKHTPVLLQETLEVLDPRAGDMIIDCTFGQGGHSTAIAEAGAQVLALDADEQVVDHYQNEAKENGITLVHGNFAQVREIAQKHGYVNAKAVLFDFGLSMFQYSQSERGFSYKQDGEPLDMRLTRTIEATAEDIITSFSGEQLYAIFAKNSQDINSRAIAQSVYRSHGVIHTVGDLKTAIQAVVKGRDIDLENTYRRIFQALYMEVNQELGKIAAGLEGAYDILGTDGKIVTISFHSGHERAVKQFARKRNLKTKKIEIHRKLESFERSATLRVIEK